MSDIISVPQIDGARPPKGSGKEALYFNPQGPLDNQKYEAYSQGLAMGLSQIQAYTKAGFKPNRANASKIAARPEVKARLATLLARIGTRESVTREALTEDLIECKKRCISAKDRANERLCIMDIAKLNGLIVEKKQVQGERKVQWVMADGALSRRQWESQFGAPALSQNTIPGDVPRKINGDGPAEK